MAGESKAELVMLALLDRLTAGMPLGVKVHRNAALPASVPASGWVCLRDGDPGRPDVLMSPLTFVYEHAAEVDLVVDASLATRDLAFDRLKVAVGQAIAADRTLGGLCDFVLGEAPEPVDLVVEGGVPLKAATVSILLIYSASDPLGA